VWGLIASSSPCSTSTGQRTRRHSSIVPSASTRGERADAIRVSALVSSPQPTPSSICFVEWGSVKILEMKNSTNPR
jgi:hypothetical protein